MNETRGISLRLPSIRNEVTSAAVLLPRQLRVLAAMVLADLLLITTSLFLGFLLRHLLIPIWPVHLQPSHWLGLIPVLALIPLALWWAGCYPGYGLRGVERLRRRVKVVAAAWALSVFIDYLVLGGQWSRGVLLMAYALALVLLPLGDALLRELLVSLGWWGMPVVVVGQASDARRAATTLLEHPHLGYCPVGILNRGGVADSGDLPVFSDISAIRSAHLNGAAAVVIMQSGDADAMRRELRSLPFYRVILVPGWSGLQTLWLEARDLGGMLGLEMRQNLLLLRNRMIKKTMDLVLVGPLFLLSLPVIALFAALIKLVDRGPAFYAQDREGLNGRLIKVWKLRTMVVDSQAALDRHLAANPEAKSEWNRFCKLKRDPRILPLIGRFMRKTSIDELPQLWNVVCNDLSLVGPRPFPYYHLEKFPTEFRKLRASVMPGVTGLWQVSDRSDADLERQEMLDTYYIRNWSPWMDIQLLLRTVWTLLFRRGGAC